MSGKPGWNRPILERLVDKFEVQEDGCWIWTAARYSNGYGVATGLDHKQHGAHRVMYEVLVGPISDGLQLDHLCRARACVNPDHLEPVTCQTNLLRGGGFVAYHARVTQCPRGHPYDEANTKIDKKGRRLCRTCYGPGGYYRRKK